MVFNSYIFILLFMPVVYAGYRLLIKGGFQRFLNIYLLAVSLFFYDSFSIRHLFILVV